MTFEKPIWRLLEGLGNTIYGSPGGAGGGGGGVATVAADNGVSAAGTAVNPIIELGQAVGAVGDPAKLLNAREIPMNGFTLDFRGSAANTGVEIDNAGDMQLTGFLAVGGLFSPDAYTYFFGTPNNYATVYPGHGVADQFYAGWQRFDGVNTYPRPNVVGQYWSYNYDTGGNRVQAAEAGFGFRTETDFDLNAGGQDYFELHLPEVAVPSGLTFRPWSFYINKTTGSTIHQSQVQSYNFNTKNENETYIDWTCTTTGGPPDTDRSIIYGMHAKGNAALTRMNFDDQGAIWAPAFLEWDRGSINFGLSNVGASVNNRVISITGNIRQGGVIGSGVSFIQTFSQSDQPTEFSAQLFSDTFANNPSYVFDRRLASGSSLIGDGNNGGEITWTGDRNLNISGIANGVGGGVNQCYDLQVSGIDPADDLQHVNMLLSNAGPVSFPRGTIKTVSSGLGAGAWALGQKQAAVIVVDLTKYIEVAIDGTVYKLVTAN